MVALNMQEQVRAAAALLLGASVAAAPAAAPAATIIETLPTVTSTTYAFPALTTDGQYAVYSEDPLQENVGTNPQQASTTEPYNGLIFERPNLGTFNLISLTAASNSAPQYDELVTDGPSGLKSYDVELGQGPTVLPVGQDISVAELFPLSSPSEISFVSAAVDGNPATAMPEPTTWTMMLVGLGGMGGLLRHARKKAAAGSDNDVDSNGGGGKGLNEETPKPVTLQGKLAQVLRLGGQKSEPVVV